MQHSFKGHLFKILCLVKESTYKKLLENNWYGLHCPGLAYHILVTEKIHRKISVSKCRPPEASKCKLNRNKYGLSGLEKQNDTEITMAELFIQDNMQK